MITVLRSYTGNRLTATLRTLSFGLLALACLYVGGTLLIYHFRIITDPNPQAYREGGMLLSTHYLLEGKNPFNLENMPLAINVYGLFYHVVVLPFAWILGPGLLAHRLVSGISILISCFILYRVLLKNQTHQLYAAAAVVILYAALLFNDSSLSKPCSLGTALFLGAICIPYLYKYTTASLLVSVLLGLLAFYTKPYFILAPFYTGTHLFLFRSRRIGLLYCSTFLLLLISSALLINHFFVCYFPNSFFNHLNINIKSSTAYALRQVGFFSELNAWLFFIVAVYLFKFLPGATKNSASPPGGFSLWVYAFLGSLVLIFVSLGRHHGNWMVYLFELLTPFLLIIILSLTSKLNSNTCFLIIPLLIFTVYNYYARLPHEHYTCPQWNEVRALVDAHHNILNTPAIAPLLIEKKKKLYDSGLTEYFRFSNYPDRQILSFFLPENERISERYEAYENDIARQVKNKEFDLIILSAGRGSPLVPLYVVEEHYYRYASITLCMAHTRSWKNDLWKPKRVKDN
jgi:hypothetical protein